MIVLLHVCFYAVDLETNEFVQNTGKKKSVAISFNRDVDVECSTDGDKVICISITEHPAYLVFIP